MTRHPVCRHLRQRDLFIGHSETGCALGHPLRGIIKAKTNEPLIDVLPRLCCKGGGTDILDCPSLDTLTQEEIAAKKANIKRAMDAAVKALVPLMAIKAEMIEAKEEFRTVDCPYCGASETLRIFVNIKGNQHMNCTCDDCGMGMME